MSPGPPAGEYWSHWGWEMCGTRESLFSVRIDFGRPKRGGRSDREALFAVRAFQTTEWCSEHSHLLLENGLVPEVLGEKARTDCHTRLRCSSVLRKTTLGKVETSDLDQTNCGPSKFPASGLHLAGLVDEEGVQLGMLWGCHA